jgi:hypothetical protein
LIMATKTTKKPTKKSTPAKKTKRLTKPQMRVVIAKDVLAALDAKKFKANTGDYLYLSSEKEKEWAKSALKLDMDAQSYHIERYKLSSDLPRVPIKAPKECSVCAIGSVFVAAVDRFDKLTPRDAFDTIIQDDSATMIMYLSKWFSEDQLRLMEAVFEESAGIGVFSIEEEKKLDDLLYELQKELPEWGKAEYRMRWIMKNIIKNKGTFVI